MSRIETIECRLSHIREIVPKMRKDERAEFAAAEAEPRHLLVSLWRDSFIRRAVLVDGELAAVWGCTGLLASPIGEAWLVPTAVVERVPVAFLKEARKGVREMLRTKDTILGACIVGYDDALRFLSLVGFKVCDPYPAAPKGVMFHLLRMEA